MASKNKTKPPSSPAHNKYGSIGVAAEKRRRIGDAKLLPGTVTRTQSRKAFADVNGAQDLPPSGPQNNAESNCSVVEFTKEDVEALVNEKAKLKNKFDSKEKSEQMSDYIRRLKQCIKWFQQLEGTYLIEQDKLKSLLESAEKKCIDMELLMKGKEDELNSIVMELRKNLKALQEKFAKEEVDKLEALDALAREKDARLSAERSEASLLEKLKQSQEENASANQKIQSLDDMYKQLQDYNKSLQQYNNTLQAELHEAKETLKLVEKEKVAVVEKLSTLRGHHTSLQEQLTSSRTLQDESVKQKEVLGTEVSCLRVDLQQVREDRDRQLSRVEALSAEVEKYRELTGKSAAMLDSVHTKTKDLEMTCSSQSEKIRLLQDQLGLAQKELQLSDRSKMETRFEFEEQKSLLIDLQKRLADAELEINEGEKLRKKLHNTILVLFTI